MDYQSDPEELFLSSSLLISVNNGIFLFYRIYNMKIKARKTPNGREGKANISKEKTVPSISHLGSVEDEN